MIRCLPSFSGRLLILAVGLICVACDSGSPSHDEQTTFSRSINGDPETLDPHTYRTTQAGHVIRDISEGLVTYSPDGSILPAAAISWEISDGGLEYTFHMRPDAVWSNGEPVTAFDFERSFRRLFDPLTGSPSASLLKMLANAESVLSGDKPVDKLGVSAVDDKTLRFRLSSATPYFLQVLTHPSTVPIHMPSIERLGNRWTAPGNMVTNGAYTLRDRVIGSDITLSRNELYWDDAGTFFDTVVYKPLEPSAELLQYRAGELDFTGNLDMRNFEFIRKARPGEVKISPAFAVYYYAFNLTRPPFKQNPLLRQALSMAIDRKTIVESVIGRGELPAYSFVPPGIEHYTAQEVSFSDMSESERQAEARRLYKEAGYGPDRPASFELRYNTLGDHEKVAVAIQSMWIQVLGVDVDLVKEEFKVFISNVQAMDETEAYRLSWVGEYQDPYTFLQLFETGNPNNLTGYSNPQFDEQLRLASSELDLEARASLLEAAERIALSDHAVIPLYFYVNKHLVAPDISGFQPNPFDIHYSKDFRRSAESPESSGER